MMHEEFSSDLFVQRTKEILNQYAEAYKAGNFTKYHDVTLSVNCLYGLLMVPEQRYESKLSSEDAITFLETNKIQSSEISVEAIENNPGVARIDIGFNNMIRGIRNGLAHWENSDQENHNKTTDKKYDADHNVDYHKNDKGVVDFITIHGMYCGWKKIVTVTFYLFQGDQPANPIEKLIELIKESPLQGETVRVSSTLQTPDSQ
jgi:hypothetical protein